MCTWIKGAGARVGVKTLTVVEVLLISVYGSWRCLYAGGGGVELLDFIVELLGNDECYGY